MILSDCKPRSVFYFFEKLCEIPHGSGNEKAISDYVTGWAKGKGLKVIQDELNNVCIFKPGTPGYENRPAVIIQGHLDMVNEMNSGTKHDFLKDPLKLRVNGDFVSAEGTTLGADDGIAIAYGMALLDAENISHPPLEMMFTTDEEMGMSGAVGLDTKIFTGKRLINMDSDDEGMFYAGCAGGVRVDYRLKIKWETPAANRASYKISVSGLKGGHSGGDINLERANGNRVLARALQSLTENGIAFGIASVSGGMKINAIPREAEAIIYVAQDDAGKMQSVLADFAEKLTREYRVSDSGLKIECVPAGAVEKVMSANDRERVITSLMLLPLGVISMSLDIAGLTETSVNIGVVETEGDEVIIKCMPRSSVASRLETVKTQILMLARLTGAEVVFSHQYPAWEFDPDSKLRKTAVDLYKELTGKDAEIAATHGGLECGILSAKMPGMDIISFGPDAYDIHTPDERLSVSSTERVWEYLIELLKRL